jgi:hypothetical protein
MSRAGALPGAQQRRHPDALRYWLLRTASRSQDSPQGFSGNWDTNLALVLFLGATQSSRAHRLRAISGIRRPRWSRGIAGRRVAELNTRGGGEGEGRLHADQSRDGSQVDQDERDQQADRRRAARTDLGATPRARLEAGSDPLIESEPDAPTDRDPGRPQPNRDPRC